MSSSQIIKSYLPTYYFKADNSTVNSDGSVNPTVTTGGSNTFFTSGGAWDTGYINSPSATSTGSGFQHSDTTGLFDDKSFTISGWFNVASTPSTPGYIFHTGTAATGVILQNGNIYTLIAGGNQTAAASATLNKWNHFAWVVNGLTQELFLNGVSTGTAVTTPLTISMDSSTKYWFRQTTGGTTRNGVVGKFDELAVFDSALSSSDIYILAKSIPPVPMTASSAMADPAVSTNNLTTQAIADNAVYLFKLDTTVNNVAGVAMTGGRSFSTITNTASYQAGQSTTGGTGSWFVTNSNTVGNEITLNESSSPVITNEKGLTVEMVFYYPAYVAPDAAGQFIMTKNWSGGGVDMKFQTSGGVNYVEAGFSGNGYHTHSQGLVPGRWYHVVARWDATDDYTYLTVNGSTETSTNKNNGAGNNFATNTSMNIGGDCGLYFDYIAFYSEQYNSTKLSGTQLTDHYNTFNAARYILQSNSYAATPMLASAYAPTGGGYPASELAAFATMVNPTSVTAVKNTIIYATALTASALIDPPSTSAGTTHGAAHMNASADMGQDSGAFIVGVGRGNPMIATALITDPSVSVQKGALIKPQSLNASTVIISPPAYVLLTDDIWYSKLYLQHSVIHGETGNTAGSSSAYAFLKLFNDVTTSLGGAVTSKLTNNLPWSIVTDNPDSTATTVTYATASNEFLTATPEPLLQVGTFDDYERKAVRFRNTQFKIAEDIYKADGPYSLEFTFKTTKANQVIAQGLQRSFTGNQSATSSIGLIDGKLFASRATQPIGSARVFAHPDNKELVTLNTAYGNKAIADGAWHHIIIQYGFDGRVQFWIDGQLDIQFFADSIYGRGAKLRPYIFGSNHTNSRWQSDFETSAWSYDAAFFVESDEITDHYTASIKYEPVHAEASIANAVMPEPVVAGNRPRALMLYFWPTSTGQATNLSYANFTSNESPEELETLDYYTAPPQNYEGWDVFPVDVTGRFVSDLVSVEAYGIENIQLTTLGGTVSQFSGPQQTLKVNKRRTFRDLLTDAPRYIDLIKDIDLAKFDLIMFKNYPDDSAEKDAFSTNEVVDAYFNLRESAIFEAFLKSLRAAVDTGLSLVVTNPQLALDLKIVDRVETVPDMDDLSGYESDPYAPTQVPQGSSLEVSQGYPDTNIWYDTYKNNRARVVNTQAGITDNAGLVRTQTALWVNDDNAVRYGGPDRPFNRYEHKDSLAIGDEFLLSSYKTYDKKTNYQASPISAVKAGKVITAFANTLRRGLNSITNPYKDYAVSIAVNPGDILNGTQVGGRIFVNFTENINESIEEGSVDLRSDYWINYAYENGAIDADQRDAYLAAVWNTDATPYWSSDGMNILVQVSEIQDENLQKKGTQTTAAKIRKVNKNGGISFTSVASGSQYFALQYSWQYPRARFEVPSFLTRGFRWLSNREVIDGTVIRPQAFTINAEMPGGIATPDRDFSYNVQSMSAIATIIETPINSGNRTNAVLPATATATIVKPGSTFAATPMTANAILRLDSKAKVALEDQVVLYLIHVDPILYIREDVIK